MLVSRCVSMAILALGLAFAHPSGGQEVHDAPRFTARQGAVSAELAVAPTGASMTYTAQGPRGPAALSEQAAMLGGLLRRALATGKPDRIYFLAASNQPMVDRLAASLLRDRGWNPRLGAPRQGRLGPYLTSVMDREAIGKAYGDVFAAEGYRLTVATASRVMIGTRAGSGSARVPVTISELGFDAVRR